MSGQENSPHNSIEILAHETTINLNDEQSERADKTRDDALTETVVTPVQTESPPVTPTQLTPLVINQQDIKLEKGISCRQEMLADFICLCCNSSSACYSGKFVLTN